MLGSAVQLLPRFATPLAAAAARKMSFLANSGSRRIIDYFGIELRSCVHWRIQLRGILGEVAYCFPFVGDSPDASRPVSVVVCNLGLCS